MSLLFALDRKALVDIRNLLLGILVYCLQCSNYGNKQLGQSSFYRDVVLLHVVARGSERSDTLEVYVRLTLEVYIRHTLEVYVRYTLEVYLRHALEVSVRHTMEVYVRRTQGVYVRPHWRCMSDTLEVYVSHMLEVYVRPTLKVCQTHTEGVCQIHTGGVCQTHTGGVRGRKDCATLSQSYPINITRYMLLCSQNPVLLATELSESVIIFTVEAKASATLPSFRIC